MTKTSRAIGISLITLLILVPFVTWCSEERSEQQKVSEPSAKFLELLKKRGFTPKILDKKTSVDLRDWPKDSASGAIVKQLSGLKAGLPPESLPGAQFISLKDAKRMDTKERKTGLFLVDVDFVPRELPEALRSFKYTLRKDGTLLDANEEPILALVTSEVYLIQKKRTENLFNLITPEAYAANPFPWQCYSFTPWAVYHSGFHRWYDARTWADTYGPDGAGGCSTGSPHTRIDYIYTRAAVGGWGDSDHCFNCESEYSRDTWDVGYFWPAHGVPVTTHHAVYADENFSFSRTSHLTW
ncbi:MAG: hypothetical protein H6Q41_3106 [Deltaproteobacteria bacterium]|jgi:hypothetical protein|nr:hypothetical protein [Deltaproteobacteria bacterium]